MMTEMIEAIRAAVADGATPEQKELGAQACRTILTALGAERGKPMAVPGATPQHPLAGITVDQALTMLIARLTTIAEAKEAAEAKKAARAQEANAGAPPRPQAAPQIAFVHPSPAVKRAPGAAPVRRRPR
jgi:hypothetical protein